MDFDASASLVEISFQFSVFSFYWAAQRADLAGDFTLNHTVLFQIVFNELSAAEMAALPKELQLELLAEFHFLPEDLDSLDPEKFGAIERDGKKLLRYRALDYRIYFEKTDDGITVQRVLHKNTIRDFLFRAKLPMPQEDEQLSQKKEFWKLIEEGERTRTR